MQGPLSILTSLANIAILITNTQSGKCLHHQTSTVRTGTKLPINALSCPTSPLKCLLNYTGKNQDAAQSRCPPGAWRVRTLGHDSHRVQPWRKTLLRLLSFLWGFPPFFSIKTFYVNLNCEFGACWVWPGRSLGAHHATPRHTTRHDTP